VQYYHYMFRPIKQVMLRHSVLWNVTPCSPLKVSRLFGGTFHLHLPRRRMSQARNQHEAGNFQRTTRRCITEPYIITSVRTSNHPHFGMHIGSILESFKNRKILYRTLEMGRKFVELHVQGCVNGSIDTDIVADPRDVTCTLVFCFDS
jgi:hypothetical protein